MPETITLYSLLVWLVVGFMTGFGWSVAAWVVARLAR